MTETFISAHLLLGGGGYAEMRDGIAEAVLEMDWGAGGEGGLFCSAFQCTSQTEGPILHPAQLTFYTDACVVASLHPAQS